MAPLTRLTDFIQNLKPHFLGDYFFTFPQIVCPSPNETTASPFHSSITGVVANPRKEDVAVPPPDSLHPPSGELSAGGRDCYEWAGPFPALCFLCLSLSTTPAAKLAVSPMLPGFAHMLRQRGAAQTKPHTSSRTAYFKPQTICIQRISETLTACDRLREQELEQ